MRTKLNQSGMVSIIVSTIIMTVLTLIVLSFAAIMQRERRQALDRQLSTQAFYAAESAVNDVRDQVYRSIQSGDTLTNTTTCDELDGVSEPVLDQDTEISCVTITVDPGELVFDSIGTDRSTVFTINAADIAGNPAAVDSIQFYYDDPDNETNFQTAGAGTFTTKALWGTGPGMLRAEVVPIPDSGFDRAFLRDNNRVYFGYPSAVGSGIVNWASGETAIIDSGCGRNAAWPRACRVSINNIPGGYSTFTVRLQSIYEPVSVTVGANDAASQQLRFLNAQVVVDSTGRANDVISRVKEIIPINAQYDYPENGITAGSDVCKLLEAEPGTVEVAGIGTTIDACSL